jgi:hypothetical protein
MSGVKEYSFFALRPGKILRFSADGFCGIFGIVDADDKRRASGHMRFGKGVENSAQRLWSRERRHDDGRPHDCLFSSIQLRHCW